MAKRRKNRFSGIATLVHLNEEDDLTFTEIGEIVPRAVPDDFELGPGHGPNADGVQTIILGMKAPEMGLEIDLEIDVSINSRGEVIVLDIRTTAG
jgi:hypothetical protein